METDEACHIHILNRDCGTLLGRNMRIMLVDLAMAPCSLIPFCCKAPLRRVQKGITFLPRGISGEDNVAALWSIGWSKRWLTQLDGLSDLAANQDGVGSSQESQENREGLRLQEAPLLALGLVGQPHADKPAR